MEIIVFTAIIGISILLILFWEHYPNIISKKNHSYAAKGELNKIDSFSSKIEVKYLNTGYKNYAEFKIDIDFRNDYCQIEFSRKNFDKPFEENYNIFKSKYYNEQVDQEEKQLRISITYLDCLLYDLIEGVTKKEISYREFIDNSKRIVIDLFSNINYRGYHSGGMLIPLYQYLMEYNVLGEIIKSGFYRCDFSFIHEVEYRTKSKHLDTKSLIYICGLRLNQYTVKNMHEFCNFVDKEIDELYGTNYSFFRSLFNKSLSTEDIMNEFPDGSNKSKSYYYSKRKEEPIKSYLEIRQRFPKKCKKYRFNGNSRLLVIDINYGFNSFNLFLESILLEIFSSIILANENSFRVSRDLPKIGEGWIAETDLFYQIKSAFSHLEVIHHGKPEWLGKQHVDIWIPEHNIGIEYHGEQHYQPIALFGGEEAFIKTNERDERKRNLFEENKASLIEVQNGYEIDDVLFEIESIIG